MKIGGRKVPNVPPKRDPIVWSKTQAERDKLKKLKSEFKKRDKTLKTKKKDDFSHSESKLLNYYKTFEIEEVIFLNKNSLRSLRFRKRPRTIKKNKSLGGRRNRKNG